MPILKARGTGGIKDYVQEAVRRQLVKDGHLPEEQPETA